MVKRKEEEEEEVEVEEVGGLIRYRVVVVVVMLGLLEAFGGGGKMEVKGWHKCDKGKDVPVPVPVPVSASASASNASLQSTGPKIIPYLRYLSQYGKVIIISRGARVSWGGGVVDTLDGL